MQNELGNVITWPGALANQAVLNWSDAQPDAVHSASHSLPSWWADYVTGPNFEGQGWDGVILEAAAVPSSYFGYAWDIDENGLNDFGEAGKGRAFVNAEQYEGWNEAFQDISTNSALPLVSMLDGGWQPNPTGFNDPPAMRTSIRASSAGCNSSKNLLISISFMEFTFNIC